MKDDKKGGVLAAMFSGPKGSGDVEGEDMDDETGMKDAKMMAAKDAMAAFKSGDADLLSDALERHYEACKGGSTDTEEY